MKYYQYIYQSKGKIHREKIRALNAPEARIKLKKLGISPLNIKELKEGRFKDIIFGPPKVTEADIVSFSQLFASSIQSGLTIKDALKILGLQIENRVLHDRIVEILVDLEGGVQLSVAFSKHVDVFPDYYPMLIKAGEVSGDIASVMEYIGNYLERIQGVRKELSGLFTYPIIVLSITGLMCFAILLFVAPKFKSIFAQSVSNLPLPTKVLFVLSDVFKGYFLLIFLGIFLSIFLFKLFIKFPFGLRQYHKFQISMPLFGKVFKETMLFRFLKAFDILVNNNVPMLQSLKVLEESSTNVILKDIIIQMRQEVSRGLPISGALVEHKKIVPPIVSFSISMGEKSGNLGLALNKIGGYIDKEITYSIKKLSSRLDPIMTLILGIIVLSVVLSIYLPIFDMISSVSSG